MPGIEYNVDIVLKTIGDPNAAVGPSVGKLESATKKLGHEFYKLGRSASDAFTGAVERAGALAMTVGKVGVAAGFGAAVYGVTKLNAGLETAKTSIGAVLNAEGYNGGRGFAGALARADGLMQSMRKHAVDLPGEFEDLFGIFQTGLGAAVKSGIDPEAFETMSANAMAAGKALAVPLDQAGRELAQLLGGRAGAHNVFGSRLGIDAHSTYREYGGKGFNQLEGAQRVAVITKALEKFEPAIAAFGTTFDAASSTFVDNIKQFGGRATLPLFDRVKSTLFEVNDWLAANQVKVRSWADKIGNGLVEAFDCGRRKIEEWWPAVREFASNAYDRITTIWKDVAPLIQEAGAAFKEFLANPDSIAKIESVLKLYAAAKVGGGVADTFGGVASAGLNVYTMSKLARGAGAAGSTELATTAGAAAGRAGLLSRLGGAGLVGGGLFVGYDNARNNRGTGWGTAGSVAAGAGGGWMLGGPLGALIGAGVSAGGTVLGRGQRAYDDWTKTGRRSDIVNLIQSSNDLTDQNTKLRDAFEDLRKRGDDVGLALADAAIWAKELANMKLPDWANVAPGGMANMPAWAAKEWHRFLNAPKVDLVADPDDPSYAAARDKQKHAEKLKGTGQTIIGRVEITVSSNQAPGQIARRVVDELQGLRRHPRASRYGRRFDGTAEQ